MREIFAIVLLLAMVVGAVWNVNHLDGIIHDITELIDEAEALASRGEFERSANTIHDASQIWQGSSSYTSILLRHPEIDSCSDALSELYGEICAGDFNRARGAFEKVRAHLNGIADMEHLSFGSVF